MKISVFTPLYSAGNPFIADTYASLLAQSHTDWEWVVLINNGGQLPDDAAGDARVRVVFTDGASGVGALKSEACSHCTGDVLLELDHDDLLRDDALFHVATAFADASVGFVYSDFAEFRDQTWEPVGYGTGPSGSNPMGRSFGWRCYPVKFQGHDLLAYHAPTEPVAWRRLVWCPNHLRAWRRSTYEHVGGHDKSLDFADDHDLILRTYLSGAKCSHIPECLYFYRVHEQNNVRTRNWDIQVAATQVYSRYVNRLAQHIAVARSLRAIDLCGGIGTAPGYEPWDLSLGHDLDQRWPAEDSTVGVIRSHDAIEHLTDKVHTMNEAYRVLAPGGFLLIMVPTTDAMVVQLGEGKSELINGSGAYCDPTHVSFWNEKSFRYYTDAFFARYVTSITARFQVSSIETINAGGIPYVKAELIALKPGYEPMGEVRI